MKRFLLVGIVLIAVCSHAQDSVKAPGITKPPKNGKLYVVAHRGAHQGIPENSIAAYQRAIDLGCDFVEIDLRTTKDGHLVSIHNSTVDAYGDFTGVVSEMTLAEIRALDIGQRMGAEWEGTQVPTFDEILELCKGKIGIYLDMKDATIAAALERVLAHGMESDVLFLNSASQLEKLMELSDRAIPMPDPGTAKSVPRAMKRLNASVFAPVWRTFSREYVEICHAEGALVIVDEADRSSWPIAIAWGADGIQTDHPAELLDYLDRLE